MKLKNRDFEAYQNIVAECLYDDKGLPGDPRPGNIKDKAYDILEALCDGRAQKLCRKPFHNVQEWIVSFAQHADPTREHGVIEELSYFVEHNPALAAQMELHLQVLKARYEVSIAHKNKVAGTADMLKFYDDVYAHSFGVAANMGRFFTDLTPEQRKDLHLPKGQELAAIFVGAIFQDFGKLAWPDELNVTELRGKPKHKYWQYIYSHPTLGGVFIDVMHNKGIIPGSIYEAVYAITTQHHENYSVQKKRPDSGYPSGLAGSEIAPIAMIARIIDFFDAFTRERGYKPKIPKEKAFEIMAKDAAPDCKIISPEWHALMRPENMEPYLDPGERRRGHDERLSRGARVLSVQNPARQ